jgi:hypothetical protein
MPQKISSDRSRSTQPTTAAADATATRTRTPSAPRASAPNDLFGQRPPLSKTAQALGSRTVRMDSRLSAQMPVGSPLRQMWDSMTETEQRDFNLAFRSYATRVDQRLEEGWRHGALGNAKSQVQNGLAGRHTLHQEQLVARADVEARERAYPADMTRLRAELASAGARHRPVAQRRIDDRERQHGTDAENLRARWGQCADWQQEVLHSMRRAGLNVDTRNILDGASREAPFSGTGSQVTGSTLTANTATIEGVHAFVVVTLNRTGQSVAFDPWNNGRAEVTMNDTRSPVILPPD